MCTYLQPTITLHIPARPLKKKPLLQHPSPKPNAVFYISREIWLTGGHQALVICVVSHSCSLNKTQTLTNLSSAQQGRDVIVDLPS